jgi:hypothetical protein
MVSVMITQLIVFRLDFMSLQEQHHQLRSDLEVHLAAPGQ